jgi:hypothetical protein
LFQVSSNGDFLLVFGLAPPIPALVLPRFVANSEASERVIIDRPQPLAFPFHTQAVARYFRERGHDDG